jgi:uncharacterized caspase-like protein/ABC-type phosphate transport system substrate-binding protein
MAKVALLIGVSEYEPGLAPLPATIKDVEAMKQVLLHTDIGGFDEVTPLVNPQQHEMGVAIQTLFDGRQKDDLLLLFFSGHGIKDESGKLYFSARNTRKNIQGKLFEATALAASSVHKFMSDSRSRRQVVILDCCFSGAFADDMAAKDDDFVDVRNELGGEGRAVLTSSTSTQYSFAQPGADTSTYTRYIVEGLKTGAADRDEDSWISVDELHEYAKSKVQEVVPAMKPEIYAIKEGYKINIAKAPIDDPKLKYRREVEYWVEGGNGEISVAGRTALDALQETMGLSSEDAAAIETQVLAPIKDKKKKFQQYEVAFCDEIKQGFPPSDQTRANLKRLQQVLGLRDEDIALIEAPIIAEQPLIAPPMVLNPSPSRLQNSNFKYYCIIGLIGVIIGAGAVQVIVSSGETKLTSVKSITAPTPTNQYPDLTKVSNVPTGTFQYGGSTSWAFIYPKLESEIKKAYPQFDIKIRTDLVLGSGIGIEKLIDGGQDGLDFSLSSRDVSPEDKFKAQRKLFTLKAIPIVKSGSAVAVNPQLAIKALTKEQLSKIYSGEIDNWRQAGALEDIPIKFYVRGGNPASVDEFRKSLGIIAFGNKIKYVNTTIEGLQTVAKERGAIFIGPISNVVPQCGVKTLPIINTKGKTIYPYQQQNFVSPAECGPGKRNRVNIEAIYSGEYPLPVIFYVVVKQNGKKEQQAGQAYANLLLTKQGQEMIKSLQETGGLDENN